MIEQNNIIICRAFTEHLDEILLLLQAEKLPFEDINSSGNFFIALDSELVIAAACLEIYEQYGLLRSVVVKKEYRSIKIATKLVEKLETIAMENGLKNIYLLTETASGYFTKKGYSIINREETPGIIRSSSEFSKLCPVTALVLKKEIEY